MDAITSSRAGAAAGARHAAIAAPVSRPANLDRRAPAAADRPAGAVHRVGPGGAAAAGQPVLLPTPGATLVALAKGMAGGPLLGDFLASVSRTLQAFVIAGVIGVPLGVLLGSNEKAYRSVEFLVDFFRSTPSSALIPLFLMIFGVTDMNKIAIAAFAAVLVILFNSAYGVINARKQRVMAARVMGASRWQIFKDVLIWGKPAADLRGPAQRRVDGAGHRDRGRDVHRLGQRAGQSHHQRAAGAERARHVRLDPTPARWAMSSTYFSCSWKSAWSTGAAGNHVHRHQPRHRAIARPAPFVPGPAGTHHHPRPDQVFRRLAAVRGLQPRHPQGKIVSVFGPNGCGKSTLINMIAGLIPIDAGEILFDGKSLAQNQDRLCVPELSRGHVPVAAHDRQHRLSAAARGRGKAGVDARVEGWWPRSTSSSTSSAIPTSCPADSSEPPSIMRALAPGPEVLFLDEPFSALDFEMTLFIRESCRKSSCGPAPPCCWSRDLEKPSTWPIRCCC